MGGSRPNKLRCHFLIRVGQYERELIDVPIRDENDRPLWLIHFAQSPSGGGRLVGLG
jgi:hypothetical protein